MTASFPGNGTVRSNLIRLETDANGEPTGLARVVEAGQTRGVLGTISDVAVFDGRVWLAGFSDSLTINGAAPGTGVTVVSWDGSDWELHPTPNPIDLIPATTDPVSANNGFAVYDGSLYLLTTNLGNFSVNLLRKDSATGAWNTSALNADYFNFGALAEGFDNAPLSGLYIGAGIDGLTTVGTATRITGPFLEVLTPATAPTVDPIDPVSTNAASDRIVTDITRDSTESRLIIARKINDQGRASAGGTPDARTLIDSWDGTTRTSLLQDNGTQEYACLTAEVINDGNQDRLFAGLEVAGSFTTAIGYVEHNDLITICDGVHFFLRSNRIEIGAEDFQKFGDWIYVIIERGGIEGTRNVGTLLRFRGDQPIGCDGICFADITTTGSNNGVPDGVGDLSDNSYYLTLWSAGDSAADLTTTGTDNGIPDGAVDLSDFSYWLTLWSEGQTLCGP